MREGQGRVLGLAKVTRGFFAVARVTLVCHNAYRKCFPILSKVTWNHEAAGRNAQARETALQREKTSSTRGSLGSEGLFDAMARALGRVTCGRRRELCERIGNLALSSQNFDTLRSSSTSPVGMGTGGSLY